MRNKLLIILLVTIVLNLHFVSADLTEELTSYYQADISDSFPDEVGNNNGTNQGGTEYVTNGKINGAYSYNGQVNAQMNLNHDIFFSNSDKWSVSFWATLDNTGVNSYLIGRREDGDNSISLKSGVNQLKFEGNANGAGYLTHIYDLEWHHYVFQATGNGNIIKIYVDGELIGNVTPTTTEYIINTFGRGISDNGYNHYGLLDEIGIWSRELSQNEVEELYNNGEGLAYPFLHEDSNTDLAIFPEDILFSDDYFLRNTTITITAFFHNLLEEDPDQVLVRFYSGEPSNETQIGEQLIIIDGGKSTFFAQTEWTPELDGNYDIHVWIDPENEIIEANESNNIAFKTLHVKTKPDLRIRNSDIGFSNNHPIHGQNIQLMAMVRNMENEPSGPFTVRFYDGNWTNLIGETQLNLTGLDTQVAIINWTATYGTHDIFAFADSTFVVSEWDETNNEGHKLINVTRTVKRTNKEYQEYHPD